MMATGKANTSMPSPFTAPARVNFIGEHTDYTGGLVLPMAIPFTTKVELSGGGFVYRFRSAQFPTGRSMAPEDRGDAVGDWSDYPVGVLRQLQARGIEMPAFELVVSGNVPLGSGLSSSASIEVATAFALLAHAGATLSREQIAKLCQRAENEYVHSPCGIMDQFVITAAEEGNALLLNTRTLEYRSVPLDRGDLAGVSVVVCNSMVKHSIASGDYGERRREVEAGQAALREAVPGLRDLGEATVEDLEKHRDKMSRESYLRCRHIVTENARVRAVEAAMLAGDAATTGDLLLQAHASQRDDFQCSCDEIDFMVDHAAKLQGCYGARMTGGGFGGCTVNLVVNGDIPAFVDGLTSAYNDKFGITAETYICKPAAGAWQRNQSLMPGGEGA